MRWRLLIEEYNPELIYIPGETNIVADALSRLELMKTSDSIEPDKVNRNEFADNFALNESDFPSSTSYPASYKTLMRHQQKDASLLSLARTDDTYKFKDFASGGHTRKLICMNDKIVVPKILPVPLVKWYHTQLCHPGITRTELTIRQHFTWNGLTSTVKKICSTCHTCQITKRKTVKYGKLPEKIAEAIPWETLCIDLIGLYNFKQADNKVITL